MSRRLFVLRRLPALEKNPVSKLEEYLLENQDLERLEIVGVDPSVVGALAVGAAKVGGAVAGAAGVGYAGGYGYQKGKRAAGGRSMANTADKDGRENFVFSGQDASQLVETLYRTMG